MLFEGCNYISEVTTPSTLLNINNARIEMCNDRVFTEKIPGDTVEEKCR